MRCHGSFPLVFSGRSRRRTLGVSRRLSGRAGGYPPGPPHRPVRAPCTHTVPQAEPLLPPQGPPCSAVHWRTGARVGERTVSPLFLASGTLCPASPSLQWVAWASLPHLHRSYDPRRLPPVLLRALCVSLAPRYRACSRRSWCPQRARCLVEAPRPRQGLWSPGPPVRAYGQGARRLSHVPEFPL